MTKKMIRILIQNILNNHTPYFTRIFPRRQPEYKTMKKHINSNMDKSICSDLRGEWGSNPFLSNIQLQNLWRKILWITKIHNFCNKQYISTQLHDCSLI